MADERIDFGDEEYGEHQKLQHQGSGAIPALADEMGEDDEYDDLYNDVNVGENFLQMHRTEAQAPPAPVGNGGFQVQNAIQTGGSQSQNIPGVTVEGNYLKSGAQFSVQKDVPVGVKGQESGSVAPVKVMGFQGSTSVPSNMSVHNERLPLPNAGTGGSRVVTTVTTSQMNVPANVNPSMMNENQIRPPIENGSTMLFVGELHWWTTDAELEGICSQYGRVKEIKFFDERASGKSKGYCQVEFHDAAAASACKEGMNGYLFNGRACVVAFASPQTLKQMGASYGNKSQVQPQNQGRRPINDGVGRGGNMNFQSNDAGRNQGRGGWGRGQAMMNRGPGGGGPVRGRGTMGGQNMVANAGGVGIGANGGGGYGQGFAGPAFGGPAGGMMPPQAMMGAGFDPTYMARGAGYGGFAGPGFPGMLPAFPAVNAMGLAGVAPHVNPAFFGRGMAPNGMGMMGPTGMDGPNVGMWSDNSMGGWGEEQGRRIRESSYADDDGASEYGYGEVNNEKGAQSSVAPREKDRERASERDWSGNSDRRHRDEREQDWDRSEREHREHRYKEERESYRDHRHRERDSGYEDDRDRGQSSSRSRREDHRSRSRDVDYGKRKRLPSD